MGLGLDLAVEQDTFGTDSREWLGTAHGTQATRTITIDSDAFIGETIDGAVIADGDSIPSGIPLSSADGVLFAPAAGAGEQVTITVDATGGTWSATIEGEAAVVAFNITAANLRAALGALAGRAPEDFTVTGGPGDAGGTTPYVVTWVADGDMPAIVVADVDLAGGGDSVGAVTVAGTGTDVAAGHLYSSVKVKTGRKIGCALYDHGKVRVSKLPVHAASADARAPHIIYLP